jgi:hypothetical protein
MKSEIKKITHTKLTTEWIDEGNERFIQMTQGNELVGGQTVVVHPSQLITAFKALGIISNDCMDKQTIARLERRLVIIRDRIEILHESLGHSSTEKHPDLAWDMLYTSATLDLAHEFCDDSELS